MGRIYRFRASGWFRGACPQGCPGGHWQNRGVSTASRRPDIATSVADDQRSFSRDRTLASQAGQKGGQKSGQTTGTGNGGA